MAPKERQKIEIDKTHRDPLLSFNQLVTADCSDFLGTALVENNEFALIRNQEKQRVDAPTKWPATGAW
jgi:hypothetical protein